MSDTPQAPIYYAEFESQGERYSYRRIEPLEPGQFRQVFDRIEP